ncbi:MAG: hypothetical protein ACFFCQ_04585 [Promethearchaeota archaeon]
MTLSSKTSLTTQTRQRVLRYLNENPEIIRCVRGFQKDRMKLFLERIETFDGFSLDKDIKNDSRFFHHVALRATLNFIALYPNIDHTPSSLRALFSVPTRRNRKKGKHSGKVLRDEAMALNIRPDNEIFQDLITKVSHLKVDTSHSEQKQKILQKLKEINQRVSPPFHPQNLENDHSKQDLEHTADFISSVIPEAEFITLESEELLAPDLVFRLGNRVFFVELKVWDPSFQLLLKPAFQVFKYATSPYAHGAIFVLANENPNPTLFDQMEGRYSGQQILQIVKRNLEFFNKDMQIENLELKILQEIGTILIHKGGLTTREACILQSIIAEMTSESLGKANMDLRTGRLLKGLLQKHKRTLFEINRFTKKNARILSRDRSGVVPILQGRLIFE